jgi:hypothetical protein
MGNIGFSDPSKFPSMELAITGITELQDAGPLAGHSGEQSGAAADCGQVGDDRASQGGRVFANDGETEERDQKRPPGLGALPERGVKRGSAQLSAPSRLFSLRLVTSRFVSCGCGAGFY